MTTPGWEHLTQAERNLRATLIGAIPAAHPVWEKLEGVVDAAIRAAEAAMRERCLLAVKAAVSEDPTARDYVAGLAAAEQAILALE